MHVGLADSFLPAKKEKKRHVLNSAKHHETPSVQQSPV
jgi:hypothetical protein